MAGSSLPSGAMIKQLGLQNMSDLSDRAPSSTITTRKGVNFCPVGFIAPLATILLLAIVATPTKAHAEEIEIHDGRLSIEAAYGFDTTFYQTDQADGANPYWGHGVFLRVGGERCGVVCLGVSVLGSVNIRPTSAGSVGPGLHIGARWGGPSWAGAYNFRFGVNYQWTYSPEPEFDDVNLSIDLGDGRGGHGMGIWLALGVEFIRNVRLLTPTFGIKAQYTNSLTVEPREHHLSAQLYFGLTFGRRLVFGEGELIELETQDGDDAAGDTDVIEDNEDEDEQFELDAEEERRLEELEDELRD